jgi:hypothetical protein
MSWFTDVRDAIESVAVMVGNYYLPGSSLLTSKLVSEGSQDQLSSDLGVVAQLTSGGLGVAQGNLSNYGKLWNAATGSTPADGLATDTQANLIGSTGQESVTSGVGKDVIGKTAQYPQSLGMNAGGSGQVTQSTGSWDKIASILEQHPIAAGLAVQGAGAIMAGMGASEKARIEKEKQDYERQQNERQLANINAPVYNPVRANPYKPVKPVGLISPLYQPKKVAA